MQENIRQQYLQAMGIQLWEPRMPVLDNSLPDIVEDAVVVDEPVAVSNVPVTPEIDNSLQDVDWQALQQRVQACTACELHQSRTQTVFGSGDPQASLMIIGEAPGADEDRQGEPFVGRAGQLLTEMLLAIGLKREQVFIANILKCRPPNNRDPHADEVNQCRPFLLRQIELIQPDLILALGRIAAHELLQTDSPLGKLRGQLHQLAAVKPPVLVTYHPAYLLRQPAEKRKVWQDLQQAQALLHQEQGA